MNMLVHSENKLRDLEKFANENGITKDRIVNVFQSNDGTFQIIYYNED